MRSASTVGRSVSNRTIYAWAAAVLFCVPVAAEAQGMQWHASSSVGASQSKLFVDLGLGATLAGDRVGVDGSVLFLAGGTTCVSTSCNPGGRVLRITARWVPAASHRFSPVLGVSTGMYTHESGNWSDKTWGGELGLRMTAGSRVVLEATAVRLTAFGADTRYLDGGALKVRWRVSS